MQQGIVVIAGIIAGGLALLQSRKAESIGVGAVAPPASPPGTTSTHGGIVPFWNGVGIVMGNGNILLQDGRIVTPQGQLVSTLSGPATTQYYAATAAQSGGNSNAIIKMGLRAITSKTSIKFLNRVLTDGSPEQQAGTAQQLIRDPSVIDETAMNYSDVGDMPPAESWLDTTNPVDLGTIAPDLDADIPIDQFVGDLPTAPDLPTSGPAFDDVGLDAYTDMGGLESAGDATGSAVEAGEVAAAGEDMVSDLASVGTIAAVIGAAISIGFDLASDMPDDQKAVSLALDLLNLALAFIPVIGWALAIVASILKSFVVGMFGELSHEQREIRETARILEEAQGIWKSSVRHSVTPTQLWCAFTDFSAGSNPPKIAVAVQYTSIKDGKPRVVDVTTKAYKQAVVLGDPQDFIDSIVAIPGGLSVRIQGGVTPSKLAAANAFIHDVTIKRATTIQKVQQGDLQTLKSLAHVWHMSRDPIVWVADYLERGEHVEPGFWYRDSAAREMSVSRELPLMNEVLVSLYYNDLAAKWGFFQVRNGLHVGDWRAFVGTVVQPDWAMYRATTLRNHRKVSFPGFLRYMHCQDIRDLRRNAFKGVYTLNGEHVMYEEIANRLTVLESNLDYVFRTLAYKGLPPSITTAKKNAQGLYANTAGPSDAALAANVQNYYANQQALLQGTPQP